MRAGWVGCVFLSLFGLLWLGLFALFAWTLICFGGLEVGWAWLVWIQRLVRLGLVWFGCFASWLAWLHVGVCMAGLGCCFGCCCVFLVVSLVWLGSIRPRSKIGPPTSGDGGWVKLVVFGGISEITKVQIVALNKLAFGGYSTDACDDFLVSLELFLLAHCLGGSYLVITTNQAFLVQQQEASRARASVFCH